MQKNSFSNQSSFIMGFIVLVAIMTTVPAVTMAGPASDTISYRSSDYVIHRLGGGETYDMLAQWYLGNSKEAWRIAAANEGKQLPNSQYVVIPLKQINLGGLTADGYQTVTILCYHRFGKTCRSSLCMPADVFDRQLQYLKDQGFQSISLAMLHDFMAFKRDLPPKSVIITIDDGYRSAFDIAYPILKKHGFTATYFVYTDFVSATRSAMNWDQLRQIKADGFEIGSHTLTHSDLTKPKPGENRDAYLKRIKHELAQSKVIIDAKLKQDTLFVAWPFGKSNPGVEKLSEEVGYAFGLSVRRGSNAVFTDPLALNRDQILSQKIEKFATRLKPFKKSELR